MIIKRAIYLMNIWFYRGIIGIVIVSHLNNPDFVVLSFSKKAIKLLTPKAGGSLISFLSCLSKIISLLCNFI